MMRVLVVIPGLERGGTETYVARTAPLLRAHDVEVEVCALDASGPLAADLASAGIRVHGTRYPDRVDRSNTAVLVRTVRDLRRLLRSGRFEAVHSYLFWPDVLAAVAGRIAGCRVIASRRALHAWRHPRSRSLHGLETVGNLLAGELIANSEAVLRDTLLYERLLPRRRTVIYNGVDPDRYISAHPGRNDSFQILTLGALSPRKGQEIAIRALAQVAPEVDARLRLVGAGPDEESLRELAGELRLGSRVEFAGEREDPRSDLEAADLFLLPSRQEGFSNALLEAMASGLPAIATDVGGNAEALVHGEGGWIVPPGDPEAIAAAIRTAVSSRSRLAAMGTANRERVKLRFSLEASVARLAAWYHGGGSGAPAGLAEEMPIGNSG